MNKIKIKNNSFELPYLDEDGIEHSVERRIFKNILALINDCSCFIEHGCSDEVFSNFCILNYLRKSKYRKLMEAKEFIGINEKMFDGRYIIFFFMPKDFEWNEFVSARSLKNIYKNSGANLILYLDDLGFVTITYNPIYDEQIKNIIKKYNND